MNEYTLPFHTDNIYSLLHYLFWFLLFRLLRLIFMSGIEDTGQKNKLFYISFKVQAVMLKKKSASICLLL